MNEVTKKQLRLALAMRGGVSLAIWIGGACAEIDRLRRAGDPIDPQDVRPHAPFWRELLAPSEYSEVIVDVMAGASAGGLNSVLFATSQHYGYDLDEVRDIWLEVGGLQKLVRTTKSKLSLLDADERFLGVLQARLHELVTAVPAPPDDPPRVDVQLSATLVEPIIRKAPSPDDEPLSDPRYISRFHFAHEPRAGWTDSDFPPRAHERFTRSTWQLALAGRSTSSFPVAFEPAIVRSSRRPTFGTVDRSTGGGALVDMRGVFGDVRGAPNPDSAVPGEHDFVVADGGILDNIPLGKALDAIAAATADSPTKRYLVYLHPTGPSDTAADDTVTVPFTDVRRSFGSVASGFVGSRFGGETTLGDIAQMERANGAARLASALRRQSFSFVAAGAPAPAPAPGQPSTVVATALEALPRYRQERALGDAQSVETLLTDPISTLGGDPFPARVGDTPVVDGRWRAPLAYWSPDARQGLAGHLLGRFGARIDDVVEEAEDAPSALGLVFTGGTGPTERVVRVMIGWSRFLDQVGARTTIGDVSPGQLRQLLYDVLTLVQRNLASPRDLGWVTVAALAPEDGTWADDAAERVDGLVRAGEATVEAVCAELWGTTPGFEARRTHRSDVLAALDQLAGEPGEQLPHDLRCEIVDRVLVPIAHRLATADLPDDWQPAPPDEPAGNDAGWYVHQALSQPAAQTELSQGGDHGRRVLAALEVLCYQEFLTGSPGSEISFVRMSAANPTPLARHFSKLQEGAADPTILTADRKLAGNAFKNFAAFAKEEWRANDWMWGRLDAAATLVHLLVTPVFVEKLLADAGSVDQAVRNVERLVTTGSLSADWDAWLGKEVWRKNTSSTLTTALSAADPTDAVTAIRRLLVERRQWEILAEELAKPSSIAAATSEPAAPLPPDDTVVGVTGHQVGLETLTSPRSLDHVRLFRNLSKVGGSAVTLNAHLFSVASKKPVADPTQASVSTLAKGAGHAAAWGGRAATIGFLMPRKYLAAGAAAAGVVAVAVIGGAIALF